ncbi:hypothetical protein C408_0843 [Vibrio diabolicus E0666]|nr:hypothetical protein C408_0843 [Vibrio diabolicus E0666]
MSFIAANNRSLHITAIGRMQKQRAIFSINLKPSNQVQLRTVHDGFSISLNQSS